MYAARPHLFCPWRLADGEECFDRCISHATCTAVQITKECNTVHGKKCILYQGGSPTGTNGAFPGCATCYRVDKQEEAVPPVQVLDLTQYHPLEPDDQRRSQSTRW